MIQKKWDKNVNLPPVGATVYFIGILGIGMSALAQFLRKLGYKVIGSDRDYNSIHHDRLIKCLTKQGIQVFPQDGSAISDRVVLLVYSSAIEDDNPDFLKGKNIPKLHRSCVLSQSINATGLPQIAITGSSGKTSVTALLATTLQNLGKDVLMINGGVSKNFSDEDNFGNFKYGSDIVVYEADESDSSLVNYNPDYAILLNLSKDHYSEDELKKLFVMFFSQVKKKVFLPRDLLNLYNKGEIFEEALNWGYEEKYLFFKTEKQKYRLAQMGYHSVMNAMVVIKLLTFLGYSEDVSLVKAISDFSGVARRFEYRGATINASSIYDDYAHNVAKITTSIKTMQEKTDKLIVIFQPHGYTPLKFMHQELEEMLRNILNKATQFYFLPVFYSGGTTSFSPTSKQVVYDYQQKGINVELTSRKKIEKKIQLLKGYTVLIMGARDSSLSSWSKSLVV